MMEALSSKVFTMKLEDKVGEESWENDLQLSTPYQASSPQVKTSLPNNQQSSSGIKNSLLSVGRSKDNSYVVRGSQIGVFSPVKKGPMKYEATLIAEIPNTKQQFSPAKTMLHKNDEQLLMLHQTDKKKIYCMDLERGKVVEEWNTGGYSTTAILPDTKDSQVQGRETFMGVNNGGFFVVDPRTQSKIVRTHQYKNAATTHFRCGATTQNGDLAIGTGGGEVRLFDANTIIKGSNDGISSAPRAKSKLLGFGDPITAVDVTRDGRFILATCDEYLILSPIEDNGKTGFQKSVKRIPLLLRLDAEDVIRVGGKVNFTAAKFDVVGLETYIICSTANYIVMWDFSDLQQQKVADEEANISIPYTLTSFNSNVIADDFTTHQKEEIVIAQPYIFRIHHWEWKSQKK